MNNPTHGDICVSMIGSADIELPFLINENIRGKYFHSFPSVRNSRIPPPTIKFACRQISLFVNNAVLEANRMVPRPYIISPCLGIQGVGLHGTHYFPQSKCIGCRIAQSIAITLPKSMPPDQPNVPSPERAGCPWQPLNYDTS